MNKEKRIPDYSRPAKTPQRALETLMLTCARAERCVSDIRRTLYRWRLPAEEQGEIIGQLVKEGFVDEERYARAYVRDKVAAGNWGRRKIETGLRVKGLPREVIAGAMEQVPAGEREAQALEELLWRRYERERAKVPNEWALRTKLMRWAVGRGYDYEESQAALEACERRG